MQTIKTLVHARGPHRETAATQARARRGVRDRADRLQLDPGAGAAGHLLLGRYVLLETLGEGGFGVVWRAEDQQLRRQVAVKRVKRGQAASFDRGRRSRRTAAMPMRDRADREALATARLSHPAIASLYEARADEDWLYLVSELVEGEPLHALLSANAISDREVLEVGIAVSEALNHAHGRGVIHRDVKPANVIVLTAHAAARDRVAAKLTDFGSARVSGDETLTATGDVLGTWAYMAPEQMDGSEATAQTDLYGLALTLYEALAGVNPLRGPTPAATARRLGATLPALEIARGDLDRGLTRAVDRGLAPEPALRGTVRELQHALDRALQRGPARRRVLPGRPGRLPTVRNAAAAGASAQPRGFAVPKVVWLAVAVAGIAQQALTGQRGVAVVLAAGAAPLLLLPSRPRPAWIWAGFAPLLGMVGLAGAFPALAGQARRWGARCGLAALGYWWLVLAGPLVGRRLWLWTPVRVSGKTALAGWRDDPGRALTVVLDPLLSVGTLEGAALWALAAGALPLLVRGRSAAADIVAATVWAAGLASASPLVDSGLSAVSHPTPRGVVLGTVLAGAIAVCARAVRASAARAP